MTIRLWALRPAGTNSSSALSFMTTAFHAPPLRRKTLQEASLLEGPMLLLKSIRGFSSNRAMTWLACAPLALMGLGIFTLSAKAEELPELSAAFLANNL